MSPMRDDRQRLLDVQEAIVNIEEYAARGKETFLRDRLIQIWFVHHLQIIGEAAAGLSRELCERNPDIPWRAGHRHEERAGARILRH